MQTPQPLAHLPEAVQAAVTAFLDAVSVALGESLLGVALYGSAARADYAPGISDVNLLLLLERLDVDMMRRLLEQMTRARGTRIAPFFLACGELVAAAEAFPGKFLTIREEHKLLRGQDLLADLEISRTHLRLRCQQEACNLLLHMRRRFLMQRGHGLVELLTREIGGFLDTLRAALTLLGERFISREEAIEPAAKCFGFDPRTLSEIVSLRTTSRSPEPGKIELLFGEWLEVIAGVIEKLERIDRVI